MFENIDIFATSSAGDDDEDDDGRRKNKRKRNQDEAGNVERRRKTNVNGEYVAAGMKTLQFRDRKLNNNNNNNNNNNDTADAFAIQRHPNSESYLGRDCDRIQNSIERALFNIIVETCPKPSLSLFTPSIAL